MAEWLSVNATDADRRAADVIQQGGLIVIPTDTVYGVAADFRQPDAVRKLYHAKQRSPDKAIPILIADTADMGLLTPVISDRVQMLSQVFWPGPLTIVVPKRPDIHELVSALPTIGVRIPDHSAARSIIRACGGALAVTSANISGQDAPTTAHDAFGALGNDVDLFFDGGIRPGGIASTVVDITTKPFRILRPGPIAEHEIHGILG